MNDGSPASRAPGDGPPRVRPTGPRTVVHVTLPGGRTFEAIPGARVGEVFDVARLRSRPDSNGVGPVAAIVNGRLRELTAPLTVDAEVVPVFPTDADGTRIYRRSLVLLLVTAAGEVFPEAELLVEHTAPTLGGYYCEVRGREPFSQGDLERIEARMRQIVAADEPISKALVPVDQAVSLFTVRREIDTVRLLSHREKGFVRLYTLRGREDYFQGYTVPSTGCLRYFGLRAFPPGFMLQFPHQNRPTQVARVAPYPRLFSVFEEAGRWLDRFGIRGAGALNDAIVAGRLPEISLVAEALHEGRIARIAADIADERDRIRVVLVAGPSSSGKTTFSKRLAVQLLANGVQPFAVCLDDYFVERERTPRDRFGQLDYESLGALDVALFNEHLLSLMEGRSTAIPRYNFRTGLREAGPTVTLGRDNVIIVEGIHGLNPALVPGLPQERLYRIYVSALTQLNLDRHNRVSTTDSRLIRRLVRDAASRGYSAADTLQRWEAVTRAERQLIFPFQELSDAIFNSALVHELAILRPLAEPLLLQVRPDTPAYVEANRLLSFLEWFRPAPADPVPDNSILREFIGGSILETFRLWPDTAEAPLL